MSCNFLLVSEAPDHLGDINSSLFFDHVTADMLGCPPTAAWPPDSWVDYTRPQAHSLLSQPLPGFRAFLEIVIASSGGAREAGPQLGHKVAGE